jgi:hypothetical protein
MAMKWFQCVLGLQLIAAGFGTAGCGGPVDAEWTQGEDEPVAEVESAFQNSLSFVNCGDLQGEPVRRIREFATFLSDRIYESGGSSMRRCLNDSFLSYVNNAEWGGDIWVEFNRTGTTKITCSSNLETSCAGGYDWGGCAQIGISGEAVTIANQVINSPDYPVPAKADLLAHELAHNYGHRHPSSSENDGEYNWTVPSRVASCVRNSNSLPAGESRTNGMPGEVELGYVGRFGGTPFEFAGSGSQFVSGLNVMANATINGLEVRFSDAGNGESWSARAGGGAGVFNSRMCTHAGDVVVGVSGRARQIVNQLRVHCAPRTNLGAAYELTADGNANGTEFSTMCPAGKAVRQVRGRAGSSVDQIQLVCDEVGRSFSADHIPHKVGPLFGSTSGSKPFSLRCSGNGAFSSLVGRSGSLVNRLGGMCTATGGTLPVTTRGPVHPAIPWLGGHGGGAFTNACPSGELMVGVRVRAGSAINAVGPICAPASDWDNYSTGAHDLPLTGGSSGSLSRQLCPSYQFLVGLELWGSDKINALQAVCADMR